MIEEENQDILTDDNLDDFYDYFSPIEEEFLYDDEPDLLLEEPEEVSISDELIEEEEQEIQNELPQLGDTEIPSENNSSNQESIDIDEILSYIEEQNEILVVINDNICTFEKNLKMFETVSCCFLSFIIGCLLVYFILGRIS